MLFGSIEAGGTKFVCAVGNAQFEIVDRIQFPTTTPAETLHISNSLRRLLHYR